MAVRSGCAFCTARKLTLEHAWPRWLISNVPREKGTYVELKSPDGDILRRIDGTLEVKVRRVCVTCNTIWMADIEKANKDTLIQLADGISTSLSRESQESLTRWFTKTGMMLDFVTPEPHIPDANYKWFYQHRVPPETTYIWLSSFDRSAPAPALSYMLQPGPLNVTLRVRGVDQDARPQIASCYLQTFKIGSLIAQLFWSDIAELSHHIAGMEQSHGHTRIWPNPGETDWPTTRFSDWETLRSFGNRLFSALTR
jgi:hypothetical protein